MHPQLTSTNKLLRWRLGVEGETMEEHQMELFLVPLHLLRHLMYVRVVVNYVMDLIRLHPFQVHAEHLMIQVHMLIFVLPSITL